MLRTICYDFMKLCVSPFNVFMRFLRLLQYSYGSTALMALGLLVVDVSRSHSDTPDSVGPLWTSVRSLAHNTQKSILAGFEPAIQASEPVQIRALGRVATGIGLFLTINSDYYPNSNRLLFNMDIHGVLCEVGTESSYNSTEHQFYNV